MNDVDKLIVLKKDLQMLTNSNDDYLKLLLKTAKELITREGIKEEKTLEYEMIQIHYAAYLFRKRGGSETSMPRFLRWEMNNLLFHQKGKKNKR